MVRFIETIENLAKSKFLRAGDVEAYLREVLASTSETLGCERVNAWLFNDEVDSLESLLSYSANKQDFYVDAPLVTSDYPVYSKSLRKNEIIVSDQARHDEMNTELLDAYIIPNDIWSMIDVPLRSEGDMIGVICFEHTRQTHHWTEEEQKFTQSIAQLLSLALETRKSKKYREELESLLKQKDLLFSEINHRVKNNISIILSLINLQKTKVKDEYHELLFDEIKNKVFSMAAVQQQLHLSKNLDKINAEEYLKELVQNLNDSFGQDKSVAIDLDLKPVLIDITKAIPLGLIANEVITNSYKYAFSDENNSPRLKVSCLVDGERVMIKFKDNGQGFKEESNQGMGLDIIDSLCAQIDGEIKFENKDGLEVILSFSND